MIVGYKSIYERYRNEISIGNLKAGDRVPSIRVLASELNVARKTVASAYEILVGEGYLVSQGAKGTYVNPELNIEVVLNSNTNSAKSEFAQKSNLQPKHLRLGIPALESFPYKKWLLTLKKAARNMDENDLIMPPFMGYQPLRENIASYLNISRGLNCSPEQIFITSGYRASLRLIFAVLSTPNDTVLFENPGYFIAAQFLDLIIPKLHYIPIDDKGLNTNYLLKHHSDAKFAIVTPTHQSPTTVSMSLPRKQRLLEWACNNKSWIIEDDYDGEFHFKRKVISALKSIDAQDRVIYTGSFSKTIMPALRAGYIVMPKETIKLFTQIGSIYESGMPLFTQKALSLFMSEGHFYRHIKNMRTLYQQRRVIMEAALKQVLGDILNIELTDGGMHIIAYLKRGSKDQELAQLWQQHGLKVSPLSHWYKGEPDKYGLIIGYTNVLSLEQAINQLAKIANESRIIAQ